MKKKMKRVKRKARKVFVPPPRPGYPVYRKGDLPPPPYIKVTRHG